MKQKLTVAIAALISFFLFTDLLFAQQGMGVGTNNPQEMLDVTGAIKIGTDINNSNAAPTGGAGTIRFRAGQFEGWDGAAWIPLGGGGGSSPFILNGNQVEPDNTVVNLATDDFIFGSPSLDDDADTDHDGRFFYDKSKGAFRAGLVSGDQWDDFKRGNQSFAVGYDVTASGDYSMTLGERSWATETGAIAMGRQAYAEGEMSFAWGNDVQATGEGSLALGRLAFSTADFSYAVGTNVNASAEYSMAVGAESNATASSSIALGKDANATAESALALGHDAVASAYEAAAIGYDVIASGERSISFGHKVNALSGYEIVLGRYNSVYIPSSTTSWQATDRLFSIGNGTGGLSRSNAFTILKNGNTGIGTSTPSATLHVDGSLRFVDGNQSNGYVLTTDGAGNATWQAASTGTDDQNLTGATLTGTTLQIDIEDGSSASVNLGALVDDADADASNELQTLSISGNDITLSNGGGTVSIPTQSELKDADGDTQVKVEENVDEDRIRFYTGGTERMIVDNSGRVGIGTTSPGSNPGSFAALDIRSDAANRTSIYQVSSQNGVPYHYFVRTGGTLASPLSVGPGAQIGGISAQIYNGVGFYESASIHMNTDGVVSGDSPGLIGFHTTPSGSTTGVRRMTIKNNGNVGIGINNPGQRLHVAGSIQMSDGNQQAGYVPVSDANGKMTWSSPSAINGVNVLVDADNDTKIQVEESADEDIIRFDLAGTEHFSMNGSQLGVHNSGRSVRIGENAGAADDLTDNDNTLVGFETGLTVSTGYNNTAVGTRAFHSGNGYDNAAFGNWTLYSNNTGVRNTALGSRAGQSITGSENTIVGSSAGKDATGSGNVFLGHAAGQSESGNNKLYIENSNSITPLIYGEFDNDIVGINGNLGVGTEAPSAQLHVESTSTGDATGIKLTQGSANSLIYHNSDNDLVLRKAINVNQLVLDNGGNIGVGTETPGDELHVEGSIRMVDGNQGADKVAVSNANGTMTWTDRSSFIAYHKQAGVLSFSGSSNSYNNIAGLTSTTLNVQSGDIITLRAEAIVNFTSGSGSDDFYMRVTYGNCATGNSEEKIIRFDEDGGHDNPTTLSYLDVITAPCTGTLWFRFQIKHSGDDPWEAVDGIIVATKY